MTQKVIIWGAGGHAKVVADIFRANNVLVCGFVDTINIDRVGSDFYGSKIIDPNVAFKKLDSDKQIHFFTAIGNTNARCTITENLRSKGFLLTCAIHPNAVISPTSKIELGSVVMPHAVVNADATISECCIVNTAAIVEHDCMIGYGTHLAPGAKMGGNVRIGKKCFIGIHASIRDKVSICDSTVIGMGSVIIKDITRAGTYYGNPAKLSC